MSNAEKRIDIWVEIDRMITNEAEKKFVSAALDNTVAKGCARDLAITIIKQICTLLPGERLYIPKSPTHLCKARDERIRMKFKGDYRETAREFGLSTRQIRRIVDGK